MWGRVARDLPQYLRPAVITAGVIAIAFIAQSILAGLEQRHQDAINALEHRQLSLLEDLAQARKDLAASEQTHRDAIRAVELKFNTSLSIVHTDFDQMRMDLANSEQRLRNASIALKHEFNSALAASDHKDLLAIHQSTTPCCSSTGANTTNWQPYKLHNLVDILIVDVDTSHCGFTADRPPLITLRCSPWARAMTAPIGNVMASLFSRSKLWGQIPRIWASECMFSFRIRIIHPQ